MADQEKSCEEPAGAAGWSTVLLTVYLGQTNSGSVFIFVFIFQCFRLRGFSTIPSPLSHLCIYVFISQSKQSTLGSALLFIHCPPSPPLRSSLFFYFIPLSLFFLTKVTPLYIYLNIFHCRQSSGWKDWGRSWGG